MAEIEDMTVDWQGHSGSEVQQFIKQQIQKAQATANAKVGHVNYSGTTIYFYEDESEDTLVGSVSLSGTVYDVEMGADQPNEFNVLSSDQSKIVEFWASSMSGQIGGQMSPFIEDYDYTVGIDNGSGTFSTLASGLVRSGERGSVNIRNRLTIGANRLRISMVGRESHQQATKIFNVNLTTLTLRCNFTWHRPWIEGRQYGVNNIYFSGNLPKTLYIALDGVNNIIVSQTFPSGTNYVSAGYTHDITSLFPQIEESGIHTLSVWVEGGGVSTEVFTYNVMCVLAEDANTVQMICINNIVAKVDNYVESKLFDYATLNVDSATFRLVVSDGSTSQTTEQTVSGIQTQTRNPFNTIVEFETESDAATVAVMAAAGTHVQQFTLPLDNSTAYLPTSGAVMYMNAATRNNGSADREYINNQAAGATVEHYQGQWDGFAWGTADGWTSDDANALALVAKAGCSVTFPTLRPLSRAESGSLSIELKFRVDRIADYDTPVLSFLTTQNAGTASEKHLGVLLYPSRLTVLGVDETNSTLQSIGLEEGRTHHVVIVFHRDYAGSGQNLCSIYMNGIRNIHFSYSGTTSFGDGALHIGQGSTDMYLYMMRIYNKALEGSDVLANFISTITDGDEFTRAGVRGDNDIIDNGSVDYDMACKAGYNRMVVETNATIPSVNQQSKVSDVTLHIEYAEDPSKSFKVSGVTLQGQGTTSMKYYRWNLRFRTGSSSQWHYNDGSHDDGKSGWFDGRDNHPKVSDIVAKKNYASAMQGHKMGAVGLYHDLYAKVVGLGSLPEGAQVAVYQYPVLGFQKFNDGTYQYIGLYTVGPHKGDKATFGYDSNTYPSLMSLEGPNHAPLGTRFLHPWQDVEYDYSEETLTFGGEEAWDASYIGGMDTSDPANQSAIFALYQSEWKPAYDMVYYCSPYLKSLSELGTAWDSISKINADVSGFRGGSTGGVKNSLLQVYDGSTYRLYSYSNRMQRYVELSSLDIRAWLGDYLGGVTNPSTAQIIEARRQKFRAEANNYWATDSLLYHYCFCVLIAATDNFAKNMYPFKFKPLAQGGRWAFRQDDLDSILDTDNNGQQTKKYSVLPGDQTGDGVQVFQGGDSALWALVESAFSDELNSFMGRMLDGCVSIASEKGIQGNYPHETLENVFAHYFWARSAKYFPAEAYNKDTEWCYIEPWLNDPSAQYNNVYPLTQARGDAQYSEREWVKKHIAFIMSRYQLGAFRNGGEEYGQVSFTTTEEYTFRVRPAIDLYPAMNLGGGQNVQGARTPAGSECAITIGSTGDTTLYIPGMDWLSELGDLKGLKLTNRGGDSSIGADLSLTGKRLRKIKVGDADAQSVAFNARSVSVGANTPSLEEFDARNVTSIAAPVNLSQCKRLRRALLSGCSATDLLLPEGAHLEQVSFPEQLNTLFLRNLPGITSSMMSLSAACERSIRALYIYDCPAIDPIALLARIWLRGGNLQYITLHWDTPVSGDPTDFLILQNIAQGKAYVSGSGTAGDPWVTEDRQYGYVGYDGRSPNNESGTPVIEGVVNVDGYVDAAAWETLSRVWPGLTINCTGRIIPFEDSVAKNICVTNWGGETGGSTGVAGVADEITVEQAAAVTKIWAQFKGNTALTKFNEFRFFTGVTSMSYSAKCFGNCSNLRELTIPENMTVIEGEVLNGCSLLGLLTCLPMTAPGLGGQIFSQNSSVKELRIRRGATGYNQGNWQTGVLARGFEIVYID